MCSGAAFILGTIGNGLIIYIVAHYPRMRTLSNVFLASLATADLLLVCVCIPVKVSQSSHLGCDNLLPLLLAATSLLS